MTPEDQARADQIRADVETSTDEEWKRTGTVPWLLDRLAAATERADKAEAAAAELRARIEAEISGWRHHVSDDCWYTCAAATEEREGETCCNDAMGSECSCGLDWKRDRIRAALFPAEEAPSE